MPPAGYEPRNSLLEWLRNVCASDNTATVDNTFAPRLAKYSFFVPFEHYGCTGFHIVSSLWGLSYLWGAVSPRCSTITLKWLVIMVWHHTTLDISLTGRGHSATSHLFAVIHGRKVPRGISIAICWTVWKTEKKHILRPKVAVPVSVVMWCEVLSLWRVSCRKSRYILVSIRVNVFIF